MYDVCIYICTYKVGPTKLSTWATIKQRSPCAFRVSLTASRFLAGSIQPQTKTSYPYICIVRTEYHYGTHWDNPLCWSNKHLYLWSTEYEVHYIFGEPKKKKSKEYNTDRYIPVVSMIQRLTSVHMIICNLRCWCVNKTSCECGRYAVSKEIQRWEKGRLASCLILI